MQEIIEYAKLNNVPIMTEEGIEFLTQFIQENNIKNVLEIGSAIGYSAIKMAQISKDIKITTLERDSKRYEEALNNIEKFSLNNQIEIINIDALEYQTPLKFDLIFIDAAKAQNIKFFERFENNLETNGYIITDNMNFHGLVTSNQTMSRNLKQLIRKIKNYHEFLKNNQNYITNFYNIGDGISISKKG